MLTIGAVLGLYFFFSRDGAKNQAIKNLTENVSISDGYQIVTIRAKGGYQPRKSVAKAGLPTILRFDTKGTFDCSSSVSIPSMNIRMSLPISGETDVELPSSDAGLLRGSCSMGMYPFEIDFVN